MYVCTCMYNSFNVTLVLDYGWFPMSRGSEIRQLV